MKHNIQMLTRFDSPVVVMGKPSPDGTWCHAQTAEIIINTLQRSVDVLERENDMLMELVADYNLTGEFNKRLNNSIP